MNSKGAEKIKNSDVEYNSKKKYIERQPRFDRSISNENSGLQPTRTCSSLAANFFARKHPHLCTLVPADVPEPGQTQSVLHPRKDVFVLKVAKVGPNGDKKCKMELELVTPKYNDQPPVYRVDTRETQCDPECPCCCGRPARRKKRL